MDRGFQPGGLQSMWLHIVGHEDSMDTRVPRTEDSNQVGYNPCGYKESDTTEVT